MEKAPKMEGVVKCELDPEYHCAYFQKIFVPCPNKWLRHQAAWFDIIQSFAVLAKLVDVY